MCNSPMDFVCECEMAMMKPSMAHAAYFLFWRVQIAKLKKKSLTDQPTDPNIISERVDG